MLIFPFLFCFVIIYFKLSVRNPRLLDPSDPKNHLIITEKSAYDLEFQDSAELTEFEVKINKMIGAVERKGVFGKDLRELFIIYKGIPDEIKVKILFLLILFCFVLLF